MVFANRAEAGRSLALRLKEYASRKDVVVLGIPRGGVPVAFEVAQALHSPLDVFLLRKLGVPGHEELAFGAIASGGVRVVDEQIVHSFQISELAIEIIAAKEQQELQRREWAYRGDRPRLPVTGQIAILVDDGIATGASLLAGVNALRQLRPAKIVVAVPVAPPATAQRLAKHVDQFVCIATPDPFYAVGQFYLDFSQISDEEVIELLSRSHRILAESAA